MLKEFIDILLPFLTVVCKRPFCSEEELPASQKKSILVPVPIKLRYLMYVSVPANSKLIRLREELTFKKLPIYYHSFVPIAAKSTIATNN